MNPHTGVIKYMTETEMALQKAKEIWLDVDPASLTRKQRRAMRVSLHDHTSPLGKIATEARSKYSRHIGAKQLARRAAPDDGTLKSMEADASGLPPDGDDRAISLPQNAGAMARGLAAQKPENTTEIDG